MEMDFIHDRSNNIPFSLHDSKIKKIIFNDNILTLKIDKLFQYTENGEKKYSGDVVFYGSDLDECSVWIFDKIVYEGDFSGKAIGLKEYIEKFSGMEFEILTEGYFGYTATYTGWLWEEGKKPVSAAMYIWNTGDMVYRIDE
jgi:hypothetical protein